jgi:hypothetical protein
VNVSISENKDQISDPLLMILAQQLKLPFLQISQHLELAKRGEPLQLNQMSAITDMAIQLLEGYTLGESLKSGQTQLQLEPVAVSSVLHNSADQLAGIAKQYNCDIEINLRGRYSPIIGSRSGLETAITALGCSIIQSQNYGESKTRAKVTLAAHRSRWGIVAGAFSSQGDISKMALKRAKLLYKHSQYPSFPSKIGDSAGIFIADLLFSLMSAKLFVARHNSCDGLAVTLTPSPQLKML